METKAETQTEVKDWVKEFDGLKESGNWFKPQSGVAYKVLFLDEGGARYEQEYEGRTTTRMDFQVKVSGGEYNKTPLTWTMTVGGKTSLYGMVSMVFADMGKATGNILDVSCAGDGKKRKYTVKQFVDLMFPPEAGDKLGGV